MKKEPFVSCLPGLDLSGNRSKTVDEALSKFATTMAVKKLRSFQYQRQLRDAESENVRIAYKGVADRMMGESNR